MRGYSGKRFPWLMSGAARFDLYDTVPATYATSHLAPTATRKSLTEKLEALVQDAYDKFDREAGRRLAAVLDNHRRRLSRDRSSADELPDQALVTGMRRYGLRVLPANDR
ncbi:MAG: hypothetical protein KGL52_05735 [Rhodospirillales bacterium]|nr:hypothetical protein [Rhodospirillales bacterium]